MKARGRAVRHFHRFCSAGSHWPGWRVLAGRQQPCDGVSQRSERLPLPFHLFLLPVSRYVTKWSRRERVYERCACSRLCLDAFPRGGAVAAASPSSSAEAVVVATPSGAMPGRPHRGEPRTAPSLRIHGADGVPRELSPAERQLVLAIEGGEADRFGAPLLWFAERGAGALYGGYVSGSGYIAAHGLTNWQGANWGAFMFAVGGGAVTGFLSAGEGRFIVFVAGTFLQGAFQYAVAWMDQNHVPDNQSDGSNNR